MIANDLSTTNDLKRPEVRSKGHDTTSNMESWVYVINKHPLAYRVEKHGYVENFWNVENEIVVYDLSERRNSHKVDGRLFVCRQSKENEKSFQ